MASSNDSSNKRQKTGQLTLFGEQAFDPLKDCEVCKGRLAGRNVHRAHHELCINNRKTNGLSKSTLLSTQEDKQLKKHFETPLDPSEKASSRYATKAAGEEFFAVRQKPANNTAFASTKPEALTSNITPATNTVTPDMLCQAVIEKVNDKLFCDGHANNKAPLGMVAVASAVVDMIIRGKKAANYFNGISFTIPACEGMHNNPHYHSIVGSKLYLVDWLRFYQLDILCPTCNNGTLVNDRTNYSKNKILFPIFQLDGPPQWCMVMSMTCRRCRSRHGANDGEILTHLPSYISSQCPVEPKYALKGNNSHLGRTSTQVFDMLMTTYGNGDLCSRLLFNTLNQTYLERVSSYYSYHV